MKKYLMIGLAALAFASCAKHDFETMTQEQIVKAEYDAKFVDHFQQPASNHTWGFGSSTRAFTRATGTLADHVGAYTQANNWTRDGFHAPDPLTDGQKLRVQYYFQMNQITNPNQPDNGTIDFFMQQVYDGATEPMAGKSPEVYADADGNIIYSGDHMDHLTAGPDHLHINNFNNSTCGTYPNVANWDQTDVNDTNQQHPDQIELMLNTPTSCFSYANSNNTEIYDDQWTLVAGSVIDAYCDNNTAFQTWLTTNHPNVEDKAVVDKWNRSFIGFDYKLMPENVFTNTNAKFSDANGTSEVYDQTDQTNVKYYYDGANFVKYTNYDAEILINNEPITYLISEVNHFAGDTKGVGGERNKNDYPEEAVYNENGTNDGSLYLTGIPGLQSDKRALNLKFIKKMVEAEYYPSTNLKFWVKINDLTDGYYTDWIVSFMPATQGPGLPDEPDDHPSTYSGRIMAEDLTAGVDVTGRKSDWDFNDVVFDWAISTDGKKAYVKLLAAGGELPLRIGGFREEGDTTEPVGSIEIHSSDGLGAYMCNTGLRTVPEKKITLVAPEGKSFTDGNSILLTVYKKGEWMTIPARRGEPTAKFNCLTTTKWCDEYVDIKKAYTQFNAWVGNESVNWQKSEDTIGDLVDGKLENNAAALEALPE